jgi:hypothetical protein
MTSEEIKIANKTARSGGAVGKNAILPRIIKARYSPVSCEILDFGAGPKALHTLELDKNNFRCWPYEMGDNYDSDIHFNDKELGDRQFDLVFASNVINTLSSLSAIRETLDKIYSFVDTYGVALINLPVSPRKYKGLTKELLMDLIMEKFNSVMVENHNGTKVFFCEK